MKTSHSDLNPSLYSFSSDMHPVFIKVANQRKRPGTCSCGCTWCLCEHVESRGQPWCYSSHTLYLVLWYTISLTWRFPNRLGWLDQGYSWLPPQCQDRKHLTQCLAFCVGPGDRTWVLKLLRQDFADWVILPAAYYLLLGQPSECT